MKKCIQHANAILLFCALICLICYDIFGGLWLKGMTSSWFVILGILNLLYARQQKSQHMKVVVLIVIGLVLGMCADVLLGVAFILGIVSFALGHVMYLIAFFMVEKPRRSDLAWIVPIAIVSVFVVIGTPFIHIEDPLLQKMLVGYAVIIACMLGKGISNVWVVKNRFRSLICLGCILFWFSDLMLAIDMFGTPSRLTWILCSYTYWPAQNILAHALFYLVELSGRKDD